MLLVENAQLLTMGPAGDLAGWMTVGDEGRIEALGAGAAPRVPERCDRLDADGAFVAPGFVSAHSHLFTSASRGLGTDQRLYGWIEAMMRWNRLASPEDLYWATLHGALDFLNNGVTTAYDFTSGRLDFDPAHAGNDGFRGELRPAAHVRRQLDAKLDSGIRFVHSIMLDDAVGTPEEVLERAEAMVESASASRGRPEFLAMAVSGAVQWAADPSTAEIEVEVMRRHGLVNQAHFLETSEQVELQRSKLAWYEKAGAFGPDLLLGHFVHPTRDQLEQVAAAGCKVVWQPTSNGRLARLSGQPSRWRAPGGAGRREW